MRLYRWRLDRGEYVQTAAKTAEELGYGLATYAKIELGQFELELSQVLEIEKFIGLGENEILKPLPESKAWKSPINTSLTPFVS